MRTILILGSGVFTPGIEEPARRERALFERLGFPAPPSFAESRAIALDILLRAKAAGIITVTLQEHEGYEYNLMAPGGVDLAALVDHRLTLTVDARLSVAAAANPEYRFSRRLGAIRDLIREYDGDCRVVMVDSWLALSGTRQLAHCEDLLEPGNVTMVAPSPWGLTRADAGTVCDALGIDHTIVNEGWGNAGAPEPLPPTTQPNAWGDYDDNAIF